MKKLIIVFACIAVLSGCVTVGAQPLTDYALPSSRIDREQCMLCGEEGIIEKYQKEKEPILMLCLNTWRLGDTNLHEISKTGEDLGDSRGAVFKVDSLENSCKWTITSNTGRHNAEIVVKHCGESEVDIEGLADRLCQGCLDEAYGTLFPAGYDDKEVYYCDVLIDTVSYELYPISSNTERYDIGDYWVHIDHDVEHQIDTVYIVYNPK